jgi:ribosomal protein S18 acetylase RimI-like enzyme
MADVAIRQLGDEDAAAYRELRLRLLRSAPEAYGTTYEEAAARPLEHTAARLRAQRDPEIGLTLGAFDTTLVGMVTLLREEGAKSRHRGTIVGMGVAEEARGRGIGRALMDEALARARRMEGLEQLSLTVVIPNDAARRLYASCGFVAYGMDVRALKLGDRYWDEVLMICFL